MRLWKKIGILTLLALLSGCSGGPCVIFCHNETGIQNDYVSARDDCQSLAQDVVRTGYQVGGNRNTALLDAFARCMKQEGWGVTAPKKTTTKPGGPNDNSQLAGNPWDPSPYGIRSQQPQAIQRQPQQAYPGYPPQAQRQQVPQAYGYYPPQQQLPPSTQQRIYQNYGYTNQQGGYNPYPQTQPPQYAAPAQDYGYPSQPYSSEFYGSGEIGGDSSINSNRAGIGLAPGFQ